MTVFLVQVVEDAPYCTQLDIMDKHGCEFCAHGGECAHVEDHLGLWVYTCGTGGAPECRI